MVRAVSLDMAPPPLTAKRRRRLLRRAMVFFGTFMLSCVVLLAGRRIFHRQSTVLDDAGRVALGLEKDPANFNVKEDGLQNLRRLNVDCSVVRPAMDSRGSDRGRIREVYSIEFSAEVTISAVGVDHPEAWRELQAQYRTRSAGSSANSPSEWIPLGADLSSGTVLRPIRLNSIHASGLRFVARGYIAGVEEQQSINVAAYSITTTDPPGELGKGIRCLETKR